MFIQKLFYELNCACRKTILPTSPLPSANRHRLVLRSSIERTSAYSALNLGVISIFLYPVTAGIKFLHT